MNTLEINHNPSHQVEISAVNWSSEGFDTQEEVPAEYLNDLLFDGGATDAVSNQRSLLLNYESLPKPIPIKTAADDSNTVILGKGQLRVNADNGEETLINDVYYCPKATGTIISPGALIAKGAKMSLNGNDFKIKLKNGLTIHAVHKNHRWFMLWPRLSVNNNNEGDPGIVTRLQYREKGYKRWSNIQ